MSEGEAAIAIEAIASLVESVSSQPLPPLIDLFILDDGSASQVGDRVAAAADQLPGVTSAVRRLPHSLGFRGCTARLAMLLKWVAETEPTRPKPYDLVVKIDPDSLILRPGCLAVVMRHARRNGCRGLWGMLRPFRREYWPTLLLDLLPVGFRRKTDGDVIQKPWELRRWRPVWWNRAGLRAIARGFPRRFATGAFYVIGGGTLRAIMRAGLLDQPTRGRHGFLTSEEDLLATLLTRAVGHNVYNLNRGRRRWEWGLYSINPATKPERVERIVEARTFLVHPLKASPDGQRLRGEFRNKLRNSISRSPATTSVHDATSDTKAVRE